MKKLLLIAPLAVLGLAACQDRDDDTLPAERARAAETTEPVAPIGPLVNEPGEPATIGVDGALIPSDSATNPDMPPGSIDETGAVPGTFQNDTTSPPPSATDQAPDAQPEAAQPTSPPSL